MSRSGLRQVLPDQQIGWNPQGSLESGYLPERQLPLFIEEVGQPAPPTKEFGQGRSIDPLLLRHELHQLLRRSVRQHVGVLVLVRLHEDREKLQSVVLAASLFGTAVEQTFYLLQGFVVLFLRPNHVLDRITDCLVPRARCRCGRWHLFTLHYDNVNPRCSITAVPRASTRRTRHE